MKNKKILSLTLAIFFVFAVLSIVGGTLAITSQNSANNSIETLPVENEHKVKDLNSVEINHEISFEDSTGLIEYGIDFDYLGVKKETSTNFDLSGKKITKDTFIVEFDNLELSAKFDQEDISNIIQNNSSRIFPGLEAMFPMGIIPSFDLTADYFIKEIIIFNDEEGDRIFGVWNDYAENVTVDKITYYVANNYFEYVDADIDLLQSSTLMTEDNVIQLTTMNNLTEKYYSENFSTETNATTFDIENWDATFLKDWSNNENSGYLFNYYWENFSYFYTENL